MTKDELIDWLVDELRDGLDNAEVGRIADEDCIGLDVDGDTYFIEVKAD